MTKIITSLFSINVLGISSLLISGVVISSTVWGRAVVNEVLHLRTYIWVLEHIPALHSVMWLVGTFGSVQIHADWIQTLPDQET